MRFAHEGDENTNFFHASASCRLRRNAIPSLLIDGVNITDHEPKAAALKAFFVDLLGSVSPTVWRFDIDSLYPNAPPLPASLSSPFSYEEIRSAFLAMNKLSSPGPDGFGPSFFSTFWATVATDVREVFDSFHDASIDLARINRAFLVLLPKIDAAIHPSHFRPISLQNCIMKGITKVLTTRLQSCIHSLVDADQTGFLSGRRISENIVYAADLLRCCHTRKTPTIVFKIDFKKAFDSVNWRSLIIILRARGFDNKWCDWMESILSTGHTAILLNGVPGDWIRCRNGLRQGDPLSPYLFIIVADVLQRLIRKAWRDGLLAHPLVDDVPCPVLQYADDTLILCKASTEAAACLKTILDDFASASSLAINFHKSCFIPMHVDPSDAALMASALGCHISSFPQPYLGLPLSPTKLPPSAYASLLSSFDRRLSGWRAQLLSSGGRLVLCNAVLNNLATYFMCSFLLPKSVLESIDKRRRAFLWTGTDSCSGARCLIAWDKVLLSKQEGGFGIKDLHRQNRCLLLNFVHKLHQTNPLPWKDWFFRHSGEDIGVFSSFPSFLERIIVECLPLYRSITRVEVVSGSTTSFWEDKWLVGATLAERFPALFSHATRPQASVALVVSRGLDLVPRLSRVAENELRVLQEIISNTHLRDGSDRRFIDSQSSPPFSSREAYLKLSPRHPLDSSACSAWALRLPNKLRIFAYLADIDRLSTRANLFHKNCAPSDVCAACPSVETGRHLFFDCPLADAVWARVGVPIPAGDFSVWNLQAPPTVDTGAWHECLAAILWCIWKARNELVFNSRPSTVCAILRQVVGDLALWRWRFKAADREPLDAARTLLLSCCIT